MSDAKRTVELPDDLCSRVEERFGKAFGTLEELLVYVMQGLTRDQAAEMDESERKILEQRLRDLGYM